MIESLRGIVLLVRAGSHCHINVFLLNFPVNHYDLLHCSTDEVINGKEYEKRDLRSLVKVIPKTRYELNTWISETLSQMK